MVTRRWSSHLLFWAALLVLVPAPGHASLSAVEKPSSNTRQLIHDVRRLIRDKGIADLDVYEQEGDGPQKIGRPSSPGDSNTRTFGLGAARRRMQFAMMLPIVYKLGVITTLLTVLTVLSLKGVTIGLVLLMFAITSALAKSKYHHAPASIHHWAADADPFDRSDPQSPVGVQKQEKNIHVHVHTSGPAPPTSVNSPLRSSAEVTSGTAVNSLATMPNYYWNRGSSNEQVDYYDTNGHYNNNPNYINNNNNRYNLDLSSTPSYYNRWLG